MEFIKRNMVALIAIVIAVGAYVAGSTASAPSVNVGTVSTSESSATNYTKITALSGAYVGTFVQGGGTNATTTNGSTVLAASDMDPYDVISITPNTNAASGINVTLPAASAFAGMSSLGDTRTIMIVNGSSTAQTASNDPSITIVGGQGLLLQKATSTRLYPGKTAALTFLRGTSTSDIIVQYNPYNY